MHFHLDECDDSIPRVHSHIIKIHTDRQTDRQTHSYICRHACIHKNSQTQHQLSTYTHYIYVQTHTHIHTRFTHPHTFSFDDTPTYSCDDSTDALIGNRCTDTRTHAHALACQINKQRVLISLPPCDHSLVTLIIFYTYSSHTHACMHERAHAHAHVHAHRTHAGTRARAHTHTPEHALISCL